MTERAWELYRLSVVDRLPEGPYKDAVIAGIQHKLKLLDQKPLMNPMIPVFLAM
jgi:hypothetical protein